MPLRMDQAQFLLNSFGDLDLYSIILDNANIPLLVQPSTAKSGRYCQRGGCTADLRDHCPAGGLVLGPSGQPIVCRSACEVRSSGSLVLPSSAPLIRRHPVQVHQDVAHCQDASAYSNQTKLLCPSCTAYVNDNDALLACGDDPKYAITFCGLI